MLLLDLLFAFLIALLITVVFSVAFHRIGTKASLVSFFFIIFLTSWAGGVWIAPIGPSLWGVYWVPFLIVGLIIAFIMTASAPICPPCSSGEAAKQSAKEENTSEIFGIFFWLLIVALGITIIVRYVKALLNIRPF